MSSAMTPASAGTSPPRRPRRLTAGQKTEPAYSFLNAPGALAPPATPPNANALFARVSAALPDPFNDRQQQAFNDAMTKRLSLLWGPPGTGKTTVLAADIVGWLEEAWERGVASCICVGSSNYNAIDNVLEEVADLLERRCAIGQASPAEIPCMIARVRSDYSDPPTDDRIEDIPRRSPQANRLVDMWLAPDRHLVIGGTWMQLYKLAESASEERRPVAHWFDRLVIDEASQVPTWAASGYYLLLKEDACVVLAGDDKQLGPVYGFEFDSEIDRSGLLDCIFTYTNQTHEITPVALIQNYRTNREIAAWPRDRFYPEGYESYYPTRRLDIRVFTGATSPPDGWPSRLPWSDVFDRILDPDLPVVAVTYPSLPYTLSNPFEAQTVAALTLLLRLRLLEAGNFTANTFWSDAVGLVTPHRAQISQIRNMLVEAGLTLGTAGIIDTLAAAAIDTVDRFQGRERDVIIASYAVADRDFVGGEERFILDPRRFNVTLTRARTKFIMLLSDAILQHLPTDADVARRAAHLQLFVEDYCSSVNDPILLPDVIRAGQSCRPPIPCRLRGC